MKLKLKTLTPIHIGTGKELSPLEFFNNFRINYDKLFDLIAEEKKDDFFNWIDQKNYASFSVKDIQEKFGIKANEIISKCGLYRFNQSFQDKVREGIKDSSNRLFIPGSSIKGSLRTALLYKVLLKNKGIINPILDELLNKKNRIYQEFSESLDELLSENGNDISKERKESLINELKNNLDKGPIFLKNIINDFRKSIKDKKSNLDTFINNIEKSFKKLNKALENLKADSDSKLIKEVFICGVLKEKDGKREIKYDDQKYDLLKLVRVSDSKSVPTDTNGEICELQVYALKKERPHKSLKIFTESISENTELEFDISIDVEFLKQAKIELNKLNSDFGKKYFIGIEEKLKNLFDIDIKNDSDFDEEKIIQSILDALNEYGEAVSNLESEWVKLIKNKNNTSFSSLEKLYNIKNKFKIGFGTGFSGMTILPLLLKDPTLKQKAYEFYKALGIGFHRSTNTPLNIEEFPFTRKYSNNQTVFGGFAWVTILNGDQIELPNVSIQTSNVVYTQSRPANSVLAEIINDKSKPPKVKILEGEFSDKETILTKVNIANLGLKIGSKVYVELTIQGKSIQSARFKQKVQ